MMSLPPYCDAVEEYILLKTAMEPMRPRMALGVRRGRWVAAGACTLAARVAAGPARGRREPAPAPREARLGRCGRTRTRGRGLGA